MQNLIIKKSQQVTATFDGTPAAGKKYYFDDIPNLSRMNIVLYGIEAYTAAQLVATSSGKTVIADADKDQILVTLKNAQNEEFIYQAPLIDFIRSENGGFVVMLEPQIINLTDCYVQLVDATGVSSDEVVAFNFYYDFVSV